MLRGENCEQDTIFPRCRTEHRKTSKEHHRWGTVNRRVRHQGGNKATTFPESRVPASVRAFAILIFAHVSCRQSNPGAKGLSWRWISLGCPHKLLLKQKHRMTIKHIISTSSSQARRQDHKPRHSTVGQQACFTRQIKGLHRRCSQKHRG